MKTKSPEIQAVRQLAKVLRSVLADEGSDRLADLTDALKFRCAQLRLSWTNERINEAYRLVGVERRRA